MYAGANSQRDKEGLTDEWGATGSQGQQHGHVSSVHGGGRTWTVAETRYQGELGLPYSSQDTSLETGPSVARTSSAWGGHGG